MAHDALAHTEVADRQDVGPVHVKQEVHVDRPLADAFDREEPRRDLLVVERVEQVELERAILGLAGQRNAVRRCWRPAAAPVLGNKALDRASTSAVPGTARQTAGRWFVRPRPLVAGK